MITIANLEPAISRFRKKMKGIRRIYAGSNLERFWQQEISVFQNFTVKTFATNGYGTWPDRKRNYPWPILRKTRRYFYAATRAGAVGNVMSIDRTRFTWGIDPSKFENEYPEKHEYGTAFLPRRAVFALLGARATLRQRLSRDYRRWQLNEWKMLE